MRTALVAKDTPGGAAGFDWPRSFAVVEVPYELALYLAGVQDADFTIVDGNPPADEEPAKRGPGRPRKTPVTEPAPEVE